MGEGLLVFGGVVEWIGSVLKEVLTGVEFLESRDPGLFPGAARMLPEHVAPLPAPPHILLPADVDLSRG